jgi:hypothetical protein
VVCDCAGGCILWSVDDLLICRTVGVSEICGFMTPRSGCRCL